VSNDARLSEFLLERYASRSDSKAVAAGAERARRAAERMSREGTSVRLVRSIFVPEDETCFELYEAESLDAVREAARRAELRVDRITRAAPRPG
jgi:hypothetical protein